MKRVKMENLGLFLKYLELYHYLDFKVRNLSSGNKRKLTLLLALLNQPRIFIFDEATSGVDIRIRDKLKNIFWQFKTRGAFGIFTTHFLKDIQMYCDQLAVIKEGQLLCCDSIGNLWQHINGYYLRVNYREKIQDENQWRRFCEIQDLSQISNKPKVLQGKVYKCEVVDLLLALETQKEEGTVESYSLNQLGIDDIYEEVIK